MIRITETTAYAKIPLNYSEQISDLVFFYGLEWYGLIASDLISHRPVLTRQLLYTLDEVPKSFYLFFPYNTIESMNTTEIQKKGFSIVDSYLFDYNSKNTTVQTNARGDIIFNEIDANFKYTFCDKNKTKVHDPLTYLPIHCQEGQIYQSSDEDLYSGKFFLSSFWNDIETKYKKLINSIAAVLNKEYQDDEDILNFFWRNTRGLEQNNLQYNYLIGQDKDEIEKQTDLLKKQILIDASIDKTAQEKLLNALETMNYYKLAEYDKDKFITFNELQTFENAILNLPYLIEQNGFPTNSNEMLDLFKNITTHNNEMVRKNKVFKSETIYDHDLLNYFFSGLNGDRPITQFLNYYHVLERHISKQGKELNSFKEMLDDKTKLPDKVLKNIYNEACKQSGIKTKEKIVGKCGKWLRPDIAICIYLTYRNRIVHSKNLEAGTPIIPYINEDKELTFWVTYIKEIARHLIIINS